MIVIMGAPGGIVATPGLHRERRPPTIVGSQWRRQAMEQVAVALFGAGRIGNVHAGSIDGHPRTTLRYVVDPNGHASADLAARHRAAAVDEATALGDPDVAAIVVGSHTSTHADLVEKGLAAGKAVFCEKPIDLDIHRVREVLATVDAADQPVFMAFNRRFDPGVADVQRRAASGAIGNVELVTVISKDPDGGVWTEYLAASGGMFRDMTIHDFDIARFLLGDEPTSVSAAAATLTSEEIAAIGDVDTACVTLQCASGRIAVITNSRRATLGYDQRVEVHGSTGTLRTENPPATTLVYEHAGGVERPATPSLFVERYAASYVAEWARFVEVLDGVDGPYPGAVDGYRSLLLAEAAYVSLRDGRRVDVGEVEAALG
jgi:myo-inositol 2-dehydrogenase/D-chiro-inositol 1-dehydrogenase